MSGQVIKLSVFFVGTMLAIGFGSSGTRAESASNEMTFCKAIGISEDSRSTCMQQMMDAKTAYDKDQIAAAWVMRSPLANNKTGTSLYRPPTDANTKNGSPGS